MFVQQKTSSSCFHFWKTLSLSTAFWKERRFSFQYMKNVAPVFFPLALFATRNLLLFFSLSLCTHFFLWLLLGFSVYPWNSGISECMWHICDSLIHWASPWVALFNLETHVLQFHGDKTLFSLIISFFLFSSLKLLWVGSFVAFFLLFPLSFSLCSAL